MNATNHEVFMHKAIDWASQGRKTDGAFISEGHNRVGAKTDCTQHAALAMIHEACTKMESKSLKCCVLYTRCEPCLMRLGTTCWTELDKVYYGASAADAKEAGYVYSDLFYHSHTGKRHLDFKHKQLLRDEAVAVWNS